ncbi:MAG TPA: GNAT family N-acetyltransferase [Kofleriaceae bacterium]
MIELPDTPRWVEANGIANDPTGWRRGDALGHDAMRLIAITAVGDYVQLAKEHPTYAILTEQQELANALAAETGRGVARAVLHTLPEPDALLPVEGAVALPDDAQLDHLRPEVADEIRAARGKHTIWACYVDGLPVAFAYAPWRSAKYFDVSVDVDPSARQLGLGAIVATTLIHAEREEGREPVWGADENNVASQRLAHRLGFEAIDELWVLAPL